MVQDDVKDVLDVVRAASVPPTRDELRTVVRPAWLLGQEAGLGAVAHVSPAGLPEGLFALIYRDRPRATGSVAAARLLAMGLTVDQAYGIGLDNLRRVLPPLAAVVRDLPDNGIGYLADSVYESSRFLMHEDWRAVADRFGGHLLVAIPAVDELLYAKGAPSSNLDALSTLARQRYRQSTRGVSPAVYRWGPEGWVVVAR